MSFQDIYLGIKLYQISPETLWNSKIFCTLFKDIAFSTVFQHQSLNSHKSSVPAIRFQIHGFQKYFSITERGENELKIEKFAKSSSFYPFFRKLYNSNFLFYFICLTISTQSMGSRTLLWNFMCSKEPMEPILTQPLNQLILQRQRQKKT